MPHCHTTEDVIFEIIVEITKTIPNEGFLGTYVIVLQIEAFNLNHI